VLWNLAYRHGARNKTADCLRDVWGKQNWLKDIYKAMDTNEFQERHLQWWNVIEFEKGKYETRKLDVKVKL